MSSRAATIRVSAGEPGGHPEVTEQLERRHQVQVAVGVLMQLRGIDAAHATVALAELAERLSLDLLTAAGAVIAVGSG